MNYENVPRCNILFLGRTGAGCSSLINYLFGMDAPTGTGASVTGMGEASERGMDRYDAESASGIRLGVFDTRGIAAGDINEWKEYLCNAYQRLCLAENADGSIHRPYGAALTNHAAFHAAVYCIGDKRVQEVDAKVIAWFIANGCKTVVALTQADTRTAEQAEAMRQAVIQSVASERSQDAMRGEDTHAADADELKLPQTEMPPIDAVSVCSVEKAFGREELLEAMFGNEVDIVANILSHEVVHKLSEKLRANVDGECAALTVRNVRSNINGWRNKKIRLGIDKRLDAFMKSLLTSEYKTSVLETVQNVLAEANVALPCFDTPQAATQQPSDEAAPLPSATVNSGEDGKKESVTFMRVVRTFWRVALTPARTLWEIWFRKDREDAILLLTLYADGAEVKAQRRIDAFLPQIKRKVEDMLLSSGQKVPPLIEGGA